MKRINLKICDCRGQRISNAAIKVLEIFGLYCAMYALVYYTVGRTLSVNAPVFLLSCMLLSFFNSSMEKIRGASIKEICVELIYSFVVSVIVLVGKSVYETHSFRLLQENPVQSLIILVGGIILWLMMFLFLCKTIDLINKNRDGNLITVQDDGKILFFLAIPLVAVYFLCYLSYFPGMLSYDMPWQTEQALGIAQLDNHHPVLHTLIWKFFICLGRRIGIEGLILYTIVQLLVVLGCMLYILYKLIEMCRLLVVVIIGYLYYLLLPVLHIFSLANTKDVYFSCVFSLFLIAIKDLQGEINRRNWIKAALLGMLAVMLRNNALYVMVLMTGVCFFVRAGRRFAGVFFGITMYGVIFSSVILPVCGVSTESKINESLSVPLTQLSYVYINNQNDLSENESELIRGYIPNLEYFNPRLADNIKSNFNRSLYYEDPAAFWKLYFSVGLKEPVGYIAAFLDLNIVYWYPFADFPDPYSDRTYIETVIAPLDYYPLERESKLPELNEWYRKVAFFIADWMRNPVIYQILSLSFPAISLFICSFMIIKNKKRTMILPFLALAMLFLTYLLGPVSNFRYVYTFYLTLPFYLGSSVSSDFQSD